ncbi:hypothetical protein [Microbacterium sp. MYb64]|uniref:hypothetical protein n=1 Tax=Microbacterium sp. MYb64 TaxID=1848691 RepID=UPI000CFAEC5C|nr:hypothetical protein [Microbacterium sp. MYb64]PRB07048.1 hypothetical protein CQ044_08215 [Microbacterium sp. MYb64]
MGIRYFAFAVSTRQIAQSRECPRGCFDGADAWDHWEPGEDPTLDLDKCYPELQLLLGGPPARASFALVEGAVTHHRYGWLPYTKTLDNDAARAIADDLGELLADPASFVEVGCRFEGGRDCVPGNLVRAREFAQRVADAGFGIRYQIG